MTQSLGPDLSAYASDVLVQPDGRILTVGVVGPEDGYGSMLITRHQSNGALDASFAGDGTQILLSDIGNSGRAGALQPDGKLVAVGGGSFSAENYQDQWVVARFNTNGTLDSTFSGDGKHSFRFPDARGFPAASDVAIQPDGKILIVGLGADGDYPTGLGVARLNPDGSFDASFSGDGQTTLALYPYNEPRITLLPDGKFAIAAIGFEPSGPVGHLQVSRLNADGSLDTSFSDDGQHLVVVGEEFERVIGFQAQADGRLVAAVATFTYGAPGSGTTTALVRFNTDGALDPSFGENGIQGVPLEYGYNSGGDLEIDANGKIILSVQAGVARLTPDGQLDPTFGDNGITHRPIDWSLELGRAALAPDGGLLIVGSLNDDLTLMRYQGDGSPVPTPPGDSTPKQQPPTNQPKASPKPALRITGLRLVDARITTKQRPVLSFRLSKAARVSVKIVKTKGGVRKGTRCVKPGKSSSGKRCDLQFRTVKRSLKAGTHQLLLPRLGAGRYRVVVSGVSRSLFVGAQELRR